MKGSKWPRSSPPRGKAFSVSRVFQGVRYDITVKREGKGNTVRLVVGSRQVLGNVIPRPPAGVIQVKVEAFLS